jgi:hypothetical protein
MLPLTDILLAVLLLAVLCIPGVFDRFITALFVPVLVGGLVGLIGFVSSVVLYIASTVTSTSVLAWAIHFLESRMAALWPSYPQWLHEVFGRTPSLADSVFLLGLASLTAMMLCVVYVKLFPWLRYYYVRAIMRQLA